MAMKLVTISRTLAAEAEALHFAAPVAYVYNPLRYARQAHEMYLQRFGAGTKEVLLLGMNPGPFGMAQTGVPFGDATLVREWLGIDAPVARPAHEHPKRPVEGFACRRHEVSGARLWGWARERWGQPEAFFARFFVANYCPLAFMTASGANLTPDKLPSAERQTLFRCCDTALRHMVEHFAPRFAIGIGAFAQQRLQEALAGYDLTIDVIPHPSPANPQANTGWSALADARLAAIGIG